MDVMKEESKILFLTVFVLKGNLKCFILIRKPVLFKHRLLKVRVVSLSNAGIVTRENQKFPFSEAYDANQENNQK